MPTKKRYGSWLNKPKKGRYRTRQTQPVDASVGGIPEEIPTQSINHDHSYSKQEDTPYNLDPSNSPAASLTSQCPLNIPSNQTKEGGSVSEISSLIVESYSDFPGTRPSGSTHLPSVSSSTTSAIILETETLEDRTSNLNLGSMELYGDVPGTGPSGSTHLPSVSSSTTSAIISEKETLEVQTLEDTTSNSNLGSTDVHDKVTLSRTQRLIQDNLPEPWICLTSENGFTLLMIFRGEEPALQRHVFVGHDGMVKISVHRRALKAELVEEIVSKVPPLVSLTGATWRRYSERVIFLVRKVHSFEICAGADNKEYKDLWRLSDTSVVDNNPHGEQRYTETCRSKSCFFLVDSNKWRCPECSVLKKLLIQKRRSHQGSEYNPKTANIHLDDAQKMAKLKDQREEIKSKQKTIDRLRKINATIQKEGVSVEEDMSAFLREALESAEEMPASVFKKLNPAQKLFLKEQLKAAKVKGPSGVKWHPAILRLALLIRSLSKSAYSALAGAGMITLPSERTLYEYSHVLPATEGCQREKLDKIAEKVKQFEHPYQSYHILMFDEMHISKNLVYQKSTGQLVGYVKLSNVEQELQDFENFINSDDANRNVNPPIATQMLTFMIKGTANNIKETVATYTTSKLNQYELYSRFWEVMAQLEKRGIRVIAAVCDGSSVNRAFFKMHVPCTKLPSKLVFDTLNMCADERILYFISDVPHLIKTARNCFFKSGFGSSFSRLLTLNNEYIVWQTIRKMFNGERTKNWRRCRKLNGQNVNLNSYSCMKVSYAAEVLSRTVANDLEFLKWDGTKETVKFIRWFNDFFDILNGAYSLHHKRTLNANLAPYCSVDDERFGKLMEFLEYLNNWRAQVENLEGFTTSQKAKMLLSRETLEGIEITVRSFTGATKFLLSNGTKFVNARVFCQDHLEQYHSKQRASVGGSSNPNVQQFLHTDVKIGMLREMSDVSIRYRRGNVKAPSENIQLSDEPLAKRKKTSK